MEHSRGYSNPNAYILEGTMSLGSGIPEGTLSLRRNNTRGSDPHWTALILTSTPLTGRFDGPGALEWSILEGILTRIHTYLKARYLSEAEFPRAHHLSNTPYSGFSTSLRALLSAFTPSITYTEGEHYQENITKINKNIKKNQCMRDTCH